MSYDPQEPADPWMEDCGMAVDRARNEVRATVREWHPRCSREYGKPWCGHYEERENPSKPSKRQEWCHALCTEIPNDRYCSDHTELEEAAARARVEAIKPAPEQRDPAVCAYRRIEIDGSLTKREFAWRSDCGIEMRNPQHGFCPHCGRRAKTDKPQEEKG